MACYSNHKILNVNPSLHPKFQGWKNKNPTDAQSLGFKNKNPTAIFTDVNTMGMFHCLCG